MEVRILFEGEFIKGCFFRFILFMFVSLIFGVSFLEDQEKFYQIFLIFGANFFEDQERVYLDGFEDYSVDPKCKL